MKCDKCGNRNPIHTLALCYHDGQPFSIRYRCDRCVTAGIATYKPGMNWGGADVRPWLLQLNYLEPHPDSEYGHNNTQCDGCNLDVFDSSVIWYDGGNTALCSGCKDIKPSDCAYCGKMRYVLYGNKNDRGGWYCNYCELKYRKGDLFKSGNMLKEDNNG